MTHADRRPPKLPQDTEAPPSTIKFARRDWDTLTSALLDDGHEQSALLFCGQQLTDHSNTYLVREVQLLTAGDYLDRGALHLSISPMTLARAAKKARQNNQGIVIVHSHPFGGPVAASPIDLRTEIELCGRVLPTRTGQPSGAIVLGPDSIDARAWGAHGASAMVRIDVVGDQITRLDVTSQGVEPRDTHATSTRTVGKAAPLNEATARQELLWGSRGQDILHNARVTIVGCGGTGSHVVTQLAHLRVGHVTLIDHDRIENSNLSRIVGSSPVDIGRYKTDVLADFCRHINPDITVTTVAASVLDADPRHYTDVDVVVCATDAHGSRSLLTEASAQYLVPVVDLGVEVDPSDDAFRAGGGVRTMRPGRGCLWCAGTLSSALVREEYLPDAERALERQRGYLRGSDEAAPSVIALDGVVSSLAVLEVCQLLVGMLGSSSDRLLYRAEQRRLSTVSTRPNHDCHVCGTNGLHAAGDARRLPTRWRPASKATP